MKLQLDIKNISLFFIGLFLHLNIQAQNAQCTFKDTIFNFDFGSRNAPTELKLKSLKQYKRDYSSCPDDGYFSFIPQTANCFSGDWIVLPEDHTPGDVQGNMMLVNAAYRSSVFFTIKLNGFKPSTQYEFSVWMLNVCRLNSGCPPLPPDIKIMLETPGGRKVAEFRTGILAQSDRPTWKKYFGMFTTPANNDPLLLTMTNTTNGGCGNDFAMDDIVFRECYPVIKETPPPVAVIENKPTPPAPKPIPAPEPDKVLERKPVTNVTRAETPDVKPKSNIPVIRKAPDYIPPTSPLKTRENFLVQKIVTPEDELLIELYDNGEIDGDTVSIYHNNELVVAHAGLSEKPIKLKIKVDKNNPRHEIIMVADNLGSIPPNTSLMVVTSKLKRYEVFISSSEQKNARVVIERKE